MNKNNNLYKAKTNVNDEFYTQYEDIENEINMLFEDNPNLFKDKTVLCPCDDPEWSNFTKYFVRNFERLGLKKLISTSYAIDSEMVKSPKTLFSLMDSDLNKSLEIRGKILILEKCNLTKSLDWKYLEGNGDFKDEEITKLRDEADFIITNPPFSIFREFVDWMCEKKDVLFLIIGSNNAITYKNIFSLYKNNKIWRSLRGVPPLYYFTNQKDLKENNKDRLKRVLGEWYTNIKTNKKFPNFKLDTFENNLKHNQRLKTELKKRYDAKTYCQYDNFNAIDIPLIKAIPIDYKGIMGVPVGFIEIFNPEIFEIVGLTTISEFSKEFYNGRVDSLDPIVRGITQFKRIFIRNLKPIESNIDFEKEGFIENLSEDFFSNGFQTSLFDLIKNRQVS